MRRDSQSRAALFSAALLGAMVPLINVSADEAVNDRPTVQTKAAVLLRAQPDTIAEKPYKQPTPVTIGPKEIALDASGQIESIRPAIVATRSTPFFQDLGANGRTCFSCHQPDQAWSVFGPEYPGPLPVSSGLDPIFRPVDGAVCPTAPTATYADKQKAYSLLLSRGLIRVACPFPPVGSSA